MIKILIFKLFTILFSVCLIEAWISENPVNTCTNLHICKTFTAPIGTCESGSICITESGNINTCKSGSKCSSYSGNIISCEAGAACIAGQGNIQACQAGAICQSNQSQAMLQLLTNRTLEETTTLFNQLLKDNVAGDASTTKSADITEENA